jgi:hypothetical protein
MVQMCKQPLKTHEGVNSTKIYLRMNIYLDTCLLPVPCSPVFTQG